MLCAIQFLGGGGNRKRFSLSWHHAKCFGSCVVIFDTCKSGTSSVNRTTSWLLLLVLLLLLLLLLFDTVNRSIFI